MSTYSHACELERQLVPERVALALAPRKMVDAYLEDALDNFPSGFAVSSIYGWCLIGSGGQGPFISMVEHAAC